MSGQQGGYNPGPYGGPPQGPGGPPQGPGGPPQGQPGPAQGGYPGGPAQSGYPGGPTQGGYPGGPQQPGGPQKPGGGTKPWVPIVAIAAILVVIGGLGLAGWKLIGSNGSEPAGTSAAEPTDAGEPTSGGDGEGGELTFPETVGDYKLGTTQEQPSGGETLQVASYLNSEAKTFGAYGLAGGTAEDLLKVFQISDPQDIGGALCGNMKGLDYLVCATNTGDNAVGTFGVSKQTDQENAEFATQLAGAME